MGNMEKLLMMLVALKLKEAELDIEQGVEDSFRDLGIIAKCKCKIDFQGLDMGRVREIVKKGKVEDMPFKVSNADELIKFFEGGGDETK